MPSFFLVKIYRADFKLINPIFKTDYGWLRFSV